MNNSEFFKTVVEGMLQSPEFKDMVFQQIKVGLGLATELVDSVLSQTETDLLINNYALVYRKVYNALIHQGFSPEETISILTSNNKFK